jgi:hypothetical protein
MNRFSRLHWLLAATFVFVGVSLCRKAEAAVTGADLWAEFVKDPARHPVLPDGSFAGYRRGEERIPTPAVVVNVKDTGAKGDGTTDDLIAFDKAIAMAAKAGGTVLVPTGTYKLSGVLKLSANGVVLRGEGKGKTTLDFSASLTDAIGALPLDTSSQWSWAGGLIWVGPADTFDGAGKVAAVKSSATVQNWEYWRPGKKLASATAEAKRGDTKLTVSDASALRAGDMILITWSNPTDFSFVKHVYGHAATQDAYDWKSANWIVGPEYPRYQWPVQIKSVQGNVVELVQPLRIDVRAAWDVAFESLGSSVSEVGVEGLSIRLHAPMTHTHLKSVGWNGVYINRAYNCWVKDVQVQSAENPIVVAASKNVTVDHVSVTGAEQNHHSFACRVNSADVLFSNFVIDGPARVKHGINVEWFSSGNVWSKGVQRMGTFDTHRGLAFDNIRTEIATGDKQDAGPGGNGSAGPFIGARMAHWNISLEGSTRPDPAQYILHPTQYVLGAQIGIRGAAISTASPCCMPAGDKGTVVADTGATPVPANLYEAQLKLRVPNPGAIVPMGMGGSAGMNSGGAAGNMGDNGAGTGGVAGGAGGAVAGAGGNGGNGAVSSADGGGGADGRSSEENDSSGCSVGARVSRRPIGLFVLTFVSATARIVRRRWARRGRQLIR